METKFKVGDKIFIKPNETHENHVKKHYGKVLEIEDIVYADVILYKIRGVANYAKGIDLEHAAYFFMTDDVMFEIIDRAVSAIDGVDIEGKDIEWIRDYILDTVFSE